MYNVISISIRASCIVVLFLNFKFDESPGLSNSTVD